MRPVGKKNIIFHVFPRDFHCKLSLFLKNSYTEIVLKNSLLKEIWNNIIKKVNSTCYVLY